VREVRRAQQLTAGAVGPAVHRADDVAARAAFLVVLQRAAPLQHDGLTVAADVGDQLDLALGVAHQCAAFALLGQGMEVAHVGHAQAVPQVAGAALEERCHLALEQRLVKVA